MLTGSKADTATVISWSSGKVQRTVRSTQEAETLAVAEALSDSLYIQKLITEMRTGEIQHFGEILPLTMYTDHQGLHLSVKEQPNVENGQVQVDLAIVGEDLGRGW